MRIIFKNVGQGDSIILEWEKDGKNLIGIIDCNTFNQVNPTLEYLKNNRDFEIEFILLTHFHSDHFSGFSDIFKFCIKNNKRVNFFYHTILPNMGEIYNRMFTTMKLGKEVKDFIDSYESFDSLIDEKVIVQHTTRDHILNKKLSMSFFAPSGGMYEKMNKQLVRKVIYSTTYADINKLSTIVNVKIDEKSILLTSDATKQSFRKIRKKINNEVLLVQAPHHGSIKNIDDDFWKSLQKIEKCPSVFSVGHEPKDKLPNLETVKYFNSLGCEIYSTNLVYGIKSFLGNDSPKSQKNLKKTLLSQFSTDRKLVNTTALNTNYSGDQIFEFNK